MKRVEQKVHKITKWDAGNVLVKLADDISEASADLSDYPEIQSEVRKLRKEITRIFNENGMVEEMKFGI